MLSSGDSVVPQNCFGRVVTIGNFDGFHIGHVALVTRAVAEAKERGIPCTLITFDPHPLTVLRPDECPRILMTLEEKIARAMSLGVDDVYPIRFDAEFADTTRDEFLVSTLVDRLQTRVVIVGRDFRCGKGGTGDIAWLEATAPPYGIEVLAEELVVDGSEKVSSSAIRLALEEGDINAAVRMLDGG
ncbi:FAD synthetase family protein [Ornithinimicrobium cryptoxanthini]|uniref:FAD synthase n=1 Tax=Ornithinimicrobium cryptoxanthini TaxID=2934161 RepID=A0ABY4YPE2_9MICO|nr:FAD synthetase family protein [Ornithinimicrobium cryptoxanthini]USQ78012.1 FAD synthetase family protein [Ornithinimicrobium cryptoxanthini]